MKRLLWAVSVFCLVCLTACTGSRAEAQDVWAYQMPGEEHGPDRGIPYDIYVDTDTIIWKNEQDVSVTTKEVLRGKVVSNDRYRFRTGGSAGWVCWWNGSRDAVAVDKFPPAKAVLDVVLQYRW